MIPPLNAIHSAICLVLLTACGQNSDKAVNAESNASARPWWASVESVKFAGIELYGQPCSITQINIEAGSPTAEIIFEVPSRLLTYCANREPTRNYLQLEGDYVILHVDRQTVGAGSRTNERYRSADLKSWEEYIGVTWVDGEEHEAWRALGSLTDRADSRKKTEPAQ